MNLKHVRVILRQTGLTLSDVNIVSSKHLKIYLPNGERIIVGKTPKNVDHAIMNAVSDIKRALLH